jgi:DNA repair exonuclease SbcCD ATPase subunit
MQNEIEEQEPQGRITIEDVKEVIGESSPFQTNASKIRKALGRGSNATVQKHLETVRRERIAAGYSNTELAPPKIPDDLASLIWAAAWSSANALTLSRLESLSAERDRLQINTDAQAADLEDLTTKLDELEYQVKQHDEALTAAQELALAEANKISAELQAKSAALATAESEIERLIEKSSTAEKTAFLEFRIEKQTLQSTIDRLTDQLGELKALRIVTASLNPNPNPNPNPNKEEKTDNVYDGTIHNMFEE